jgi:glycosyltransferase involved in cell wall biosynthesis
MGQDVKKSNRYLRILKYAKFYIVALSNNQAEQFFNITSRNVNDIIHWGIDDQQFPLSERDIDLLAVGSLIPLKNYSLFVKLIANLVKNGVDIRAVLVGDGPQRAELEELTHEFGVTNNIEFSGLLNREDIFKLMQRSKIFVHPSLFEGSGYVFAEALANGMNIVSFNVGYAQNNPKWFIVKDEEEFIKTVKKLLNDKLDFSPANIFSLKETIKRYASVYGIS